MAIKYEIMAAVGSYEKDGDRKTRWLRVGAAFERDGKLSLKLDAVPTTSTDREGQPVAWDGWLKCFEPRPRDSAPPRPPVDPDFDTDIPF